MATYNRQYLRDQLASYLRDSTLATQSDNFIDYSAKKISVMLESAENEVTAEVSIGAFPYALGGITRLRSIVYPHGQYDVALKNVPLHRIGYYSQGGVPEVYAIKGDALSVGPPVTGTYTLTYFDDVELGEDASATTPTLTRYPHLWLDAVLAEAYGWKQDGEMAGYYEQRMISTVEQINRQARILRHGEAPAMRAS
jgi:hypothetical protein